MKIEGAENMNSGLHENLLAEKSGADHPARKTCGRELSLNLSKGGLACVAIAMAAITRFHRQAIDSRARHLEESGVTKKHESNQGVLAASYEPRAEGC